MIFFCCKGHPPTLHCATMLFRLEGSSSYIALCHHSAPPWFLLAEWRVPVSETLSVLNGFVNIWLCCIGLLGIRAHTGDRVRAPANAPQKIIQSFFFVFFVFFVIIVLSWLCKKYKVLYLIQKIQKIQKIFELIVVHNTKNTKFLN